VRELTSQAAWLSLDPGDDDPLQFIGYLAATMEPVAPGTAAAVQPLLDDPQVEPVRVLEVLLGMLQRDLQTAENEQLLLVLDDLHCVDSPTLAPLMALFLERRPARLHIMLLGRLATYGPLTRLYATEQVLEMSEVELRFQPEEMAIYLVQRGFSPPTPEALAQLDAHTEGWIIALRLITAAAGDKRKIDELLAAAQSKHGWLAEYLTIQILADLPRAKRTFVLQTSILDRFNRLLLAAVTDTAAVDALLSSLVETGLPLVQLDSRQEWFRYHHLFQDLLQNRLRQELNSTDIEELHRRAAVWLAQHDQVSAAVQHALSAEDLSLAAAILETAVRPEILRGGTRQAQSWLDLFPNDALDQHPRLLLDWCLLSLMRVQKNLIDLVSRTDAALTSARLVEKERRRAQAELTIYKIYGQVYLGNFASARELIRNEDQRLADADPLTRAWFLYVQMYLAWYDGQGQVALVKGNHAIAVFQDAGLDQAEIAGRRLHAQISAHGGFPREAVAMLQEIVASAQANRSFAINELAETHAGAISLHYWLDDIEGAQREQQSALALAHRLADPVLIRQIDSLTTLFAMARATGRSSEIEDSEPSGKMGTVLLDRLNLHMLVRLGRAERAWHFALSFGVQLDGEILPENLPYFISLLEVAIARGIDLAAVRPRIDAAIAQAERLDSRLFAAELYTLSAWCQLQLGRREEAEAALARALDLAVETGYVRFILDIPALAPLLAVMDHPAAAEVWVATVPEARRRQAAQLTNKERLVLAHLARPSRYQDIADSLGISINTVRTHIRHIYRKLGVSRREEAVGRARALGLAAQNDFFPDVISS
jgi:LuxR family maltose regulon positive regulatory protein